MADNGEIFQALPYGQEIANVEEANKNGKEDESSGDGDYDEDQFDDTSRQQTLNVAGTQEAAKAVAS